MRAVIQRVKGASVNVADERVAEIGAGLLVLLGVEAADGTEDIEWLARKIAGLRIFADEAGVWEKSVVESGGSALVVSQFTLFASTKKGTKPSWHRAAKPQFAEPVCRQFAAVLDGLMPGRVKTGRFGAMMEVSLVNDGPVTILLDTKQRE